MTFCNVCCIKSENCFIEIASSVFAVHRGRNLLCKGKSDTNDAYVTISLGKDKYQTSIKERTKDPVWHEECDLAMSDKCSSIQLNVFHRNLLGIDEFLGHTDIPLEQFAIYERPRSRWYTLKNKPGSKKAEKYRGEIEVKVTFLVQSLSGSQTSLVKAKVKKSASFKSMASSMGEKLSVKWPHKGGATLNRASSKGEISDRLSFADPFGNQGKTQLAQWPSVEKAATVHTSIKFSLFTDDQLSLKSYAESYLKKASGDHLRCYSFDSHGYVGLLKRPLGLGIHGAIHKSEVAGSSRSDSALIQKFSSRHIERSHDFLPTSYNNEDKDDTPDSVSVENTPETSDVGFGNDSSKYCRSTLSDSFFSQSVEDVSSGKTESKDHNDNSESLTQNARPAQLSSDEENGEDIDAAIFGKNSPSADSPDAVVEDIKEDKEGGEEEGEKEEEEEEEEEDGKLKEKLKNKIRDASGRHTLQSGSKGTRRATHELYEGIFEYKAATENSKEDFPESIMESFGQYSRKDLIRILMKQSEEIQSRDTYIKDLEQYIDNLLVRVIEVTPNVLQNPPSPVKAHRALANQPPANPPPAPASVTTVAKPPVGAGNGPPTVAFSRDNPNLIFLNTNNSNKKISNPFKKLQAALK
ncbi:hypothetical protein CAPTEDRAFT_228126 [Capitella teleta]|uniref:C2 domain-containing protein n=1 Tax=Capitella teleta TaxID=283909 RepID=R7UP18_CAPTE|nr:hypothetical protein CAPTEDRAFT_228126 [Capitella teleta]|eukprot:ELU05121.1 hypothetical protein CAPTEDRAFT_228126 [Capitella teleta]